MNVSKLPNVLRKKNIKSRSSSTHWGNRHSSASGKSQSSTQLSSRNVDTLVRGEGKAVGRHSFFGLGGHRLTHLSDSVGMTTSTVDVMSETAVECKSYTRSYIPFLEDGNSSKSDESDAESPHKASTVVKNFVYVSCIG